MSVSFSLTGSVARILQDNVYSLEACEGMLAELAKSHGAPAREAARKRFMDALNRAESNVTEAEEVPVINRIRDRASLALDGDTGALDTVVDNLGELIQINREAMRVVDREAQRLGRAGAWSAVFMGFLTFALSLVVLRYVERSVVAPIEQVHAVLEASNHGDVHRRCHDQKAPAEIRAVMRSVNALLDRRMSEGVE
jgi:nitrate/nitrite-specific signal transduction histidine kinase